MTTPLKLEITRTFNAPRELVWKAWTDEALMKQWSVPDVGVIEEATVDFKVGGSMRVVMVFPENGTHIFVGTYKEIDPPKKLVFTHRWEESNATLSVETLVTVELSEDGENTSMKFTQVGFDNQESLAGHTQGWGGCFDKLEKMLSGVKN